MILKFSSIRQNIKNSAGNTVRAQKQKYSTLRGKNLFLRSENEVLSKKCSKNMYITVNPTSLIIKISTTKWTKLFFVCSPLSSQQVPPSLGPVWSPRASLTNLSQHQIDSSWRERSLQLVTPRPARPNTTVQPQPFIRISNFWILLLPGQDAELMNAGTDSTKTTCLPSHQTAKALWDHGEWKESMMGPHGNRLSASKTMEIFALAPTSLPRTLTNIRCHNKLVDWSAIFMFLLFLLTFPY